MKIKHFLLTFVGILFITVSCKRTHNCQCTENYAGQEESYSNVVSETELKGMKTKDAEEECNMGDAGPQSYFTETWSVDCELK